MLLKWVNVVGQPCLRLEACCMIGSDHLGHISFKEPLASFFKLDPHTCLADCCLQLRAHLACIYVEESAPRITATQQAANIHSHSLACMVYIHTQLVDGVPWCSTVIAAWLASSEDSVVFLLAQILKTKQHGAWRSPSRSRRWGTSQAKQWYHKTFPRWVPHRPTGY